MKRTTLTLSERTFAEIRRAATRQGKTVSQVVDEILGSRIAERRKKHPNSKRRRPARRKLRNDDRHVFADAGESLASLLPPEDFSDWN